MTITLPPELVRRLRLYIVEPNAGHLPETTIVSAMEESVLMWTDTALRAHERARERHAEVVGK